MPRYPVLSLKKYDAEPIALQIKLLFLLFSLMYRFLSKTMHLILVDACLFFCYREPHSEFHPIVIFQVKFPI